MFGFCAHCLGFFHILRVCWGWAEFLSRSGNSGFGCYHFGDVVRLAAWSGIEEDQLEVELGRQLSAMVRQGKEDSMKEARKCSYFQGRSVSGY